MRYNPRMTPAQRPSAPKPSQPPTPLAEMLALIVPALLYLASYFIWHTSPDNMALDALSFVSVLFIGLAIVSQFVLPVQTWADRWRVLGHVVAYFVGAHGSIIFVKQGKKIARANEATTASTGQGMALIDPSSAIVLQRTAMTFYGQMQPNLDRTRPLVRAHGPGVCFIEPGEVIVATLDLRPHKRSATARALTRDGIEISANISVTFGLNPQDPTLPLPTSAIGERNRPAYPFNPRSAFKAIYGQALGEKQPIPWTELPLSIAVEAFRHVLVECRLETLFTPSAINRQPFAEFQANVAQAVQDSPVLLDRGIWVRSVRVSGFEVPAEVLNQRLRVWQTQWRVVALENQAAAESEALQTTWRIRRDHQQTIVDDFVRHLHLETPEVEKKALALVLTQALQRLSGSPGGRFTQRLSWRALSQSQSGMDRLGDDESDTGDPSNPISNDDPDSPLAP